MKSRSWKHLLQISLILLVALAVGGVALAQPEGDAASIAVEAAKQFAGSTITIMYEAGLQAQDGYGFGPKWTELTGINVEVVEVPFNEMYQNPINDALAGTAQYDIINVIPAWMGDFVSIGVLEPLDSYIEKYYPAAELADILPTYADNWSKVGGVTYGLPDDGDVHIMYYRSDIFEDPENMAAFEAEYGYPLAAPTNWEQWNQICSFITEKYAPELYGCAFQRFGGQSYHWFFSAYRSMGGRFFDPETMRAQVNGEVGLQTMQLLRESLDYGPTGQQEWSFIEVFSGFVDGKIAMAISWPPVGRWAQGVGTDESALSWVPPTKIAGMIGYAEQPGGGELASGMALGIAAASDNKEAAYLFSQWLNSQSVSLERVISPIALRDPFRTSHFSAELYRDRWSNAGEYLDVLKAAAENGFLDLSIPGSREYQEAVDRAITAIYSGADIQATLDQLASDWNTITDQQGVDKQREAYAEWSARANAYGGS
ncbi:MAG: extracellular solute-binding protein [Anaerolineae bacterium]|nr:extracellular solute-binding protein [Anaerolineae bacterium]